MRMRTMVGLTGAAMTGYLIGAVAGRPGNERLRSLADDIAGQLGIAGTRARGVEPRNGSGHEDRDEVIDTKTVLARVNSSDAHE
jgi:hypothetical protein